jgi:regulator of PEP synthase PpsR (kinase-PPPase family)
MVSSKAKQPLTVVIISGATGRTAEQVVKSALAQFDEPDVRVEVRTNVRSQQAAGKIVREFSGGNAVICHSLVRPKVRDVVLEEARRHMIPNVDILGPVVALLSDYLGVKPHERPGLSYKRQKSYFDVMDAVSFSLEHDDGARPETLDRADVILVGVSRVSKSVTCFYLAYRGVRAANVPIVVGCELPASLLAAPKEKVIGLTVNPNRLQRIREVRRHLIGGKALDYYVDRQAILQELRHAESVFRKHLWRSVDVSYMAVEEVARQVLQMIET